MPGTSRPAPGEGESLAPPPGAGTAQPASVEETGPHFFDEDPVEGPSAADAQHGSRPEPASAWGADRSRQSGFGGGQDRRVSWGAPQGAQGAAQQGAQAGDPRVPRSDQRPDGESARTDGTAGTFPAGQETNAAAGGGTFVFRRPTGQPGGGAPADAPDDGTMTFRAVSPRTGPAGGGSQPAGGPAGPDGGPAGAGFGAQGGAPGSGGSGFGPAGAGGSPASGFGGQAGAAGSGFGPAGSGSDAAASAFAGSPSGPAFGPQAGPTGSGSAGPGFGAGKAAAARASAAQAGAGNDGAQASGPAPTALSGPQAAPTVPPQSAGPGGAQPGAAPASSSGTPLSAGPGGGQSSWAQQVHRLAGAGGDEQPVAPWKPPVEDVFQAAARRQAEARPAGLGKRLVARLLDTVVLAALTAAAAVPLGGKAIDHVNEKIDAAKLSGETVTVWLLDGTTSIYLGIILAVLLLAGVLCEVLPTAKWGRTFGKKLMGLEVRDIEGHDSPEFGAALRRWLVYSVPGLLVVGIIGVAWCLFDRPWRQCWHDKAAHTFVAG
ncbi:membrane protein [Streptomyces variegatus]|uniref:Membrane protein n=1 Tax=Streptomyces variegatus TaxID=284040 RepID=A0A0M2GLS3_9ACTN|nr:membrane protein [Streptomyces variegatus]